MPTRVRLMIMAVAAALLSSCQSTSTWSRDSSREDRSDLATNYVYLYRVDVDPQALTKGARLLFDEPPPNTEFGVRRRAQGYLSLSQRGFLKIEVRVAEPIVGLNGRRSEQRYDLLKFFGTIAPDGRSATADAGERHSLGYDLEATEVRFLERGESKMTVQAFADGRPLAYVFHFHRQAVPITDVPFPWK